MIYFILRYILHYRHKVIIENLRNAFPEKNAKQLQTIENKYYHHMADIICQTLITPFLSPKAMKSRFVVTNIEVLNAIADKGINVASVFGHYANWEWAIAQPLYTDKIHFTTVYKKIANKWADRFMLKTRSKYGVECIEHKNSIRQMLRLQRNERPNVFTFIADQTPTRQATHYWIQFLSQPTAIISGWAELAIKQHWAAIYLDIKPNGRGKYKATYHLIAEDCSDYSVEYLLTQYMSCLEQNIRLHPELWLWSHRRWKLRYNGEPLINAQ